MGVILAIITDIIAQDGRLTIKQIAKVGILSGTVFTIKKKKPTLVFERVVQDGYTSSTNRKSKTISG